MSVSYVDVISLMYPTIGVSCIGDPYVYADIVHEYGPALPSESTLDAHMLTIARDRMWENIKGERDRRTKSGGYKVGSDWYHSDDSSRIQQIALVMMGANLPPNLYWKTMAGSFVLMTQTLANQIFSAAAISDQTIFSIAEQKRQEVEASATPENYDYLTGWPLIYGE